MNTLGLKNTGFRPNSGSPLRLPILQKWHKSFVKNSTLCPLSGGQISESNFGLGSFAGIANPYKTLAFTRPAPDAAPAVKAMPQPAPAASPTARHGSATHPESRAARSAHLAPVISPPTLPHHLRLLQHQLHGRVLHVRRIFVLAQNPLHHEPQLGAHALAL